MMRALWFSLLALACLAASPAAAESRLFTDTAPLKIVITGPFPTLVRTAKTNTNPYPATLTVTDGAAPAKTLAIQISARGLTRRTAGYCNFPPILLNFHGAEVHGTVFHGQHKLKLVTYCHNEADYEQRIVLEHLVYRLYNLLTPMSFRVRTADVTYRGSDSDAGVTRFGYLIEDIDDVAERNDRDKLVAATHQVSAARLDAHAAARATLFEYMISNLDWEFLAAVPGQDCCHNSRFIAARGAAAPTATAVVPVPYDFDFSGFVDAPYALTPSSIPSLTKVTERYYRGYCVTTGEVPAVIDEFRAHQGEMLALVGGEARLTPKFRDKATHFLDTFFTLLDDPGRVQTQIIKHCR